jgi:predicted nucleic acid-binding protein
MRSRLVILDANVIIDAFATDLWNSLIDRYDVYVTSIVLRFEVYFYKDNEGRQIPIDLEFYVASGKVTEIAASVEELAAIADKVNPNLLDRIDDGEQEALALLLTGRFDDYRFCTADTRAIKALASLDLGALGVSFEELLVQIGMKNKLPNPSYSKAAFDKKRRFRV